MPVRQPRARPAAERHRQVPTYWTRPSWTKSSRIWFEEGGSPVFDLTEAFLGFFWFPNSLFGNPLAETPFRETEFRGDAFPNGEVWEREEAGQAVTGIQRQRRCMELQTIL